MILEDVTTALYEEERIDPVAEQIKILEHTLANLRKGKEKFDGVELPAPSHKRKEAEQSASKDDLSEEQTLIISNGKSFSRTKYSDWCPHACVRRAIR